MEISPDGFEKVFPVDVFPVDVIGYEGRHFFSQAGLQALMHSPPEPGYVLHFKKHSTYRRFHNGEPGLAPERVFVSSEVTGPFAEPQMHAGSSDYTGNPTRESLDESLMRIIPESEFPLSVQKISFVHYGLRNDWHSKALGKINYASLELVAANAMRGLEERASDLRGRTLLGNRQSDITVVGSTGSCSIQFTRISGNSSGPNGVLPEFHFFTELYVAGLGDEPQRLVAGLGMHDIAGALGEGIPRLDLLMERAVRKGIAYNLHPGCLVADPETLHFFSGSERAIL